MRQRVAAARRSRLGNRFAIAQRRFGHQQHNQCGGNAHQSKRRPVGHPQQPYAQRRPHHPAHAAIKQAQSLQLAKVGFGNVVQHIGVKADKGDSRCHYAAQQRQRGALAAHGAQACACQVQATGA